MIAQSQPEPATRLAGNPHQYRISVEQLLRIDRAGIFPTDRRFELLDGMVVRQMTQNPPHCFAVGELAAWLRRVLPPEWLVREEKPARISEHWLPLPDLAIVAGPARRFERLIPTGADLALVVEVADTTYATDRGSKWKKYAESNIPLYWIVNLIKRQVEVYRQPAETGVDAGYQSVEIFGNDAALPLVLGGIEYGPILVADLLPSLPPGE